MKQTFFLKSIKLSVLLMLISVTVFAQTGKIAGKVTDKVSGETLIGLTVGIDGTSKGAATDVEGRFVISNLTAGKYNVTFRYIGYQTKSITGVEVKNGEVTALNIIMEEAATQALGEVVVTATYSRATVGSLYAQQKSSVIVSDGISSESIKRSPDRNTGEVLKRVSGTSIQDNKFVIVRGLSDRYNSTLLNNAPLPSSEPDRKAFSFDVIPSNLIDQIVINKTASADLPGDFAGGVIQIKTKDFPVQKVFDVNYTIGFNSISTFNDFKGGEKGKLDLLGFDDGLRKLPSSFPVDRRAFVNLTLQQKADVSKDLNNTWAVKNQGIAIPTQNLQVVYGNSFKLKKDKKFGFVTSLSYRNSMNFNEQRRADYAELTGTSSNDFTFDYNDKIYINSINLGALANFAYSYNKSKIGFKNLYNRSYDDKFTDRTGASFEDPDFEQKNTQFELVPKSLFNSILEGEHVFGKKNYKFDWNTSFSTSSRSQPDLRRIFYTKPLGSANQFEAAVPVGSGSPKNAGRFYSDLQDLIYGASTNLSIPFEINKIKQIVKIGTWTNYRTRSFDTRQFGYIIPRPSNSAQALLTLPQDIIFSTQNLNPDGFVIDEITDNRDSYDASGFLNAGYVMFTNELTKKLKANFGARLESYQEELISVDPATPKVNNSYLDILPSANLIYSATEKTNIRLSYSNTVARAEFRELAPFSFFDFETNNVIIGNPDLKRTKIDNLDLRFEFFPATGQIFSISTFYKNFNNPIEQIFNTGSTAASKTLSYRNANSSTLYGLEIEARENLGLLGSAKWLDKLTAYTNFALIKSDVNLDRVQFPNNNDSRSLQGQSPYLINGGLQYVGDKWNFNALYNRIGRRINIVGFGQFVNNEFQPDYPDIYENPRDVIDLQISKRFSNNKTEIKLNIGDVLNQKRILYQDVNLDKKYKEVDDQTISTIKFGTNFNVSFSYKF
ncbi:TonB-dependent receptor [Pedobacter psychrophilus]|nr:TonB-dependent receptor [Pedobacter psychrophilus]